MPKPKVPIGEELEQMQDVIKNLSAQLGKFKVDDNWAKQHAKDYFESKDRMKYEAELEREKKAREKNRSNFKVTARDVEWFIDERLSLEWMDDEEFSLHSYRLDDYILENPELKQSIRNIIETARNAVAEKFKSLV